MNLWLRLMWLAIALAWRRKLDPRRDVSRLAFRVLPTDLDLNGHMNNGRYLTLMDLGRLDHVLRSGLWRPIWQNGWAPMLGSAVIRYRRELRLFQRFELETRIVTWTDTTAVMEQTFVVAGGPHRGQMAARALVKAGFYDRKDRSFVTIKRLIAELGLPAEETESPPPTPEIEAFLKAEALLRPQVGGSAGED
jgi:acyl-CoA thioesterase FadM